MTDAYTIVDTSTVTQSVIVDPSPKAYRLAQKPDGSLVLQGLYWGYSATEGGTEWRVIPTVLL